MVCRFFRLLNPILSARKLAEAATLLPCIRVMPRGISAETPTILTKGGGCGFLQTLHTNTGVVPQN
jgi:hypothetical protein